MSNVKERDIGDIGNHYGCLTVINENGKFYWGIEDYNGTFWEEISETLFNELNKHEDTREVQGFR